MAVDRKNHIFCVNESGVSRCDLFFYSSLSGQSITTARDQDAYSHSSIKFDGLYFHTYNKFYLSDSNAIPLRNSVPTRPYYNDFVLYDLLYFDDTIYATIEIYQESYFYTCFYQEDGILIARMTEYCFDIVPNVDGTKLAFISDGTNYYFINYSFSDKLILNTGS